MVNPKYGYTPKANPVTLIKRICKTKIIMTMPTNIKFLVNP